MKVNYFGYFFERHAEGDSFLADIRPFLAGFCAYGDAAFKNRFHHMGENLYLFKRLQNLYLFLMTRNNEIIKGIRNENLALSEIQELLAAEGESIGFASYLHLDANYFGFASTVMAPRFQTFSLFINQLLQSVGQDNYRFVAKPLLQKATRADALQMQFHGAATFQIDANSRTARDLMEQFNLVDDEFGMVDSISVKIVPKFRKNIRPASVKLITNLPEDGLQRFSVMAKQDANERLTELYLADQGQISDMVKSREEPRISAEITANIEINEALAQKVQEHARDDQFEEIEARFINRLSDPGSWPDSVVDL